MQNEVGREIVDIGFCRIQQPAHGLNLFQTVCWQPVVQDHFVDGLPLDVLFHDALVFPVDVQHFGHRDADRFQPLVVGQFSGQLVPKLVVVAGLVVDLLEGDGFAVCLRQPGIAALAFAKQLDQSVFPSVYSHRLIHQNTSDQFSTADASL